MPDSSARSSRARRSAAWTAGRRLRAVPVSTWMAISFAYQLRSRVMHRHAALARAAIQLQPLRSAARYIRRLREMAAHKHRPQPRPLPFDVGYDAATGQFSFRSETGTVTCIHPAAGSGDFIPSYGPAGHIVDPLTPPPHSTFELRPEATGAWCYYDSALGRSQWHAPNGSSPLVHASLEPFDARDSPPYVPPSVSLGSLDATPWVAIYQDSDSRVVLFHRLTGAIREAPWIALRTSAGRVFFLNLVSRETRWSPPRLWMDGWVMRSSCATAAIDVARHVHDIFGRSTAYSRHLLPPSLARLRVEGGAPYMGATGLPQYAPDECDSARTHPACSLPIPEFDDHGSGLPFGESEYSAVTYDMRNAASALLRCPAPPPATPPANYATESERLRYRRMRYAERTRDVITRRWG